MGFWEKLSRVDASSNKGFWTIIIMIDIGLVLLAGVMMLLGGGIVPAAVALLGILSFTFVGVLRTTVIEKSGDILTNKGSSTPSVNQHSNIETLEVRGRYQEAADAYRAVIQNDPQDIVACDKLAQLASRHLKDYELAIFAYREAEKRSTEPRRQLGYALLVAGIYRDNLQDEGRAIVELRKVLDRFPDAPNADRLREELNEMKARRFEGA